MIIIHDYIKIYISIYMNEQMNKCRITKYKRNKVKHTTNVWLLS